MIYFQESDFFDTSTITIEGVEVNGYKIGNIPEQVKVVNSQGEEISSNSKITASGVAHT